MIELKAIIWTPKAAARHEDVRLVTENECPPIPDRNYDWAAVDDKTYCGCPECHGIVGRGPTEAAAIADFWEQWEENHDLAS